MKKTWLILFSIIMAAGLVFIGCPDTPPPEGGPYEITFNAGEGVFPSGLGFRRLNTDANGKVTPPLDVELEGHIFKEWNTSSIGIGTTLTADTVHNSNTTYYAVWQQDTFDVLEDWDFTDIAPIVPPALQTINTWEITEDKLQALKDAEYGSVIRLYFDARDGSGTHRSNYGIGSIGTPTSMDDQNYVSLRTGPDTELVYYVDAEVEWLLDVLGSGDKLVIFIPIENGDMLTKIELMEPKEPRDVPERPTAPALPTVFAAEPQGGTKIGNINITYGLLGDITVGKGDIAGTDLALINTTIANLEAGNTVIMRVYVRNMLDESNRLSWGIGQINESEVLQGANSQGANAQGTDKDRANDLSLNTINDLISRDAEKLNLNPYNQHVITLIELWTAPINTIDVKLGDTVVSDIIVNGRSGTIWYLDDNIGYQFSGAAGHRGKFAWFGIDFGETRLSDYKEVKFTFEVVSSSDATRRIALLAQSTPFANSSLTNHQDRPADSGIGYLASFQVTEAMATSIANSATPLEVTLKIDPTYAATLDDSGLLYLSLYEHTEATAVIKISNIEFIVLIEGECPVCGPPTEDPDFCTCDIAISAAKTAIEAIEAAEFTTTQVNASSLTAARAAAMAIVNEHRGNVIASIDDEEFTAAEAGTQGLPEGIDGSFVFTLNLNRGLGEQQTTAELTMTITATAYEPPTGCEWCEEDPCVCDKIYDMQNDPDLASLSGREWHDNGFLQTQSMSESASAAVDMES
ncbi:MAG: InlB B-repeat-containing protein, partial [Treponema sp.]|nr:InlB B-repeat-containing protein [Treponema sp.]